MTPVAVAAAAAAAAVCVQIYAPVCGADNAIYPNKCLAGCVGVQMAADKVC
jgi:hypothetical protein